MDRPVQSEQALDRFAFEPIDTPPAVLAGEPRERVRATDGRLVPVTVVGQ